MPTKRTNSEQRPVLQWNCWQEPVPAPYREAVATWAAEQPALLPGEGMRLLRECLGLERKELASCLGIAERRVTRWENGEAGSDPAGERLLRALYLKDRATLPDIIALLELTEDWPQEVRLARHAYGWRAISRKHALPKKSAKQAPKKKPAVKLALAA